MFTFFSIKSLKSGTHVTLIDPLMGKPRFRWLVHQTTRRMGHPGGPRPPAPRVFKPRLTAHPGDLTEGILEGEGGSPCILSGTFQSPSDRDWPII